MGTLSKVSRDEVLKFPAARDARGPVAGGRKVVTSVGTRTGRASTAMSSKWAPRGRRLFAEKARQARAGESDVAHAPAWRRGQAPRAAPRFFREPERRGSSSARPCLHGGGPPNDETIADGPQ